MSRRTKFTIIPSIIKFKYSILWFINFKSSKKYRPVVIVSISVGETKAEKGTASESVTDCNTDQAF